MPLFDRYLIVDWSAANQPKKGRDSIWLCLCGDSVETQIVNIPTRASAMERVASEITAAMKQGERLLAGFDFGFGFPKGVARHISKTDDWADGWADVWQMLHSGIEDSEKNRSNRFDYAAQLNETVFSDLDGPFWGHPHQHAGRYSGLGPKRPKYESLPEKRLVEEVLPSAQPVWKLAYTGSVGSQTLLGIARLQALRKAFPEQISIWPFETGFADDLSNQVIVAEVYPSIVPVMAREDEVKDAAQVRTVAQWFQKLDQSDSLKQLLDVPQSLSASQRETVLREEGWIVGAGHHAI